MKPKKFPAMVNGILYKTALEYDERVKRDLEAFAEIAIDIYKWQRSMDKRLEEHPEGFSFPASGRMCRLCYGGGAGEMWYDKLGMRCMDCQTAYKEKIIPGYVFTDEKNRRHITATSLTVRHELKSQDIRRLIKEGKLKVRRISHKPYPDTLVFLKYENPKLFKATN